jgi:hypothetical protein
MQKLYLIDWLVFNANLSTTVYQLYRGVNIFFLYINSDTNKTLRNKEFEDTKGVIKIRISKKDRQHNGQKKKYKRTNKDLQNIHIKLKIE